LLFYEFYLKAVLRSRMRTRPTIDHNVVRQTYIEVSPLHSPKSQRRNEAQQNHHITSRHMEKTEASKASVSQKC